MEYFRIFFSLHSTRMDRKLFFFFVSYPPESIDGVGPALSQLFFNRDNLANVGTSERELTGNAKIEQQQQEE